MKTLLALTALLIAPSFSAIAEDKAPPAMDPKKAEMMKKMMEAGAVGPQHKVLEPMAGQWKYTSKWWESADGKPQESKGTSAIKMILGGRFMQHEVKGTAMGMPFQGLGLTGYNNVTGKYETLWLDSMSTGMMRGEGMFDSATQTLSDSGEYACPVTENKKLTYRGEWKIVDKNNMVYSMYGHGMNPSGPEYKEMEMTFKRAK